MSGESQQVPQSEPDPSVLTTEQLERALRNERATTSAQFDTIRQRLDDMDKATQVLNETVTRTPTEIQREVGHLKELVTGELTSVREAVAKQDQVNQTAINKAEASVKEGGNLATVQIAGLEKRVSRIEDHEAGGKEAKASQYAVISVIGTIVGIILGIIALSALDGEPPVVDPIVVEVTVVAP